MKKMEQTTGAVPQNAHEDAVQRHLETLWQDRSNSGPRWANVLRPGVDVSPRRQRFLKRIGISISGGLLSGVGIAAAGAPDALSVAAVTGPACVVSLIEMTPRRIREWFDNRLRVPHASASAYRYILDGATELTDLDAPEPALDLAQRLVETAGNARVDIGDLTRRDQWLSVQQVTATPTHQSLIRMAAEMGVLLDPATERQTLASRVAITTGETPTGEDVSAYMRQEIETVRGLLAPPAETSKDDA